MCICVGVYVCNAMTPIPRPGMLATVRNRRGTVTSVAPFDGESGRVHLVHLDYQDGGSPHRRAAPVGTRFRSTKPKRSFAICSCEPVSVKGCEENGSG